MGYKEKKTQNHDAAHEPFLFGQHSEHKIGMSCRQKSQVTLRSSLESLAKEFSRSDRDLGLYRLVAKTMGIARRIECRFNAAFLITLKQEPGERSSRQNYHKQYNEMLFPDAG